MECQGSAGENSPTPDEDLVITNFYKCKVRIQSESHRQEDPSDINGQHADNKIAVRHGRTALGLQALIDIVKIVQIFRFCQDLKRCQNDQEAAADDDPIKSGLWQSS